MPAFGRKKKQQPEPEPEPDPVTQAVDAPAIAQSASMALSQPVAPAATPSAPATRAVPITAGPSATLTTKEVVVCAADFHADQNGDLDFATGDRVVVTAKRGEWWEGYLESNPAKSGQFPSSYVDAVSADAAGRDDGLGAEALKADQDLQDLVDAVTDCDLAKMDRCLDEANDLDAIVNEPFEDGTTLLWLACQLGHRDAVDRLIAAGADVNSVAFGETTPLHAATEYGHASCLEALLNAHATIDVADGGGNTPLIVAAQSHAHDCVQMLLSRGAGSDFENDAGVTALDAARHCVQSEGSTPELEDIISALEIAGQAGGAVQERHCDDGFDSDVPRTLPGVHDDGFDSDVPRTLPGVQQKRWKVASRAAIAIGRMQRTILFVVSNQGERHAVEVIGVGETTLAQLQQKIEAVLNISVRDQELKVKGKPVATSNASARLSQLGIEAMAEIAVQDRRLSQEEDLHKAAAQHKRVEASPAAAAAHSKDMMTSNASAAHVQSAENAALRMQVQQLHAQLQSISQDKAAHAATAARTEQQTHILERARKSEVVADLALPSLLVSTYQEKKPQRRGPAPQEPRNINPKAFDTAAIFKPTERRYHSDSRYERRYLPAEDDPLASASPVETLRRVNAHTSSADWPVDGFGGPQVLSVVPGDRSCTVVFRGTDEWNIRAYEIAAQSVNAQDAPRGRRSCSTIQVDEPQLQRSVTIENLENFVEVLITVAAMPINGDEQVVACLGTPLPCVPSKPTVLDLRTTSTSIDISVHIPDPGGAPLTSLTARIQRSTETKQRVAAVIPATADSRYSISIPGLAAGARYAVAVSATNAGGEGEAAVFWAATPPLLPRAVTLISATAADSSVEFVFTLNDDASVVSHITILTLEPGEAEPRVATILPCTEDMRQADPVRVCVAGLANWVRTEVFIVAGNSDGDGPACRFVCTPQSRQSRLATK